MSRGLLPRGSQRFLNLLNRAVLVAGHTVFQRCVLPQLRLSGRIPLAAAKREPSPNRTAVGSHMTLAFIFSFSGEVRHQSLPLQHRPEQRCRLLGRTARPVEWCIGSGKGAGIHPVVAGESRSRCVLHRDPLRQQLSASEVIADSAPWLQTTLVAPQKLGKCC